MIVEETAGSTGQSERAPSRPVEAIEARDRRPRREIQIDALLSGMLAGDSVVDAAKRAGMSRATAYEELRRRDVQDRLTEARGDMVRQAASRASSLCVEAVGILADLARESSSDSVRRQACSDILTHARALKGDIELDAKLAALTAELDAITSTGSVAVGGRTRW